MIKTALLGRYRLHEFVQFMANTVMIVKQHGADKLKLSSPYLALLQNYETLQQNYKQNNLSELTPQLARLDAQRDQAIICLRKICDGYTNHYQEKPQAAGKQILACIDKYGSKLYHLNYSAETAVLNNLTGELQTNPEYISALQEMHLENVVNEIRTINTEFEKLFVQRLEALSQPQGDSNRKLIQLTSETYRSLLRNVEAHATLTPSEQYTSLISHLNENIEYFNLIIERRKNGVETAVDTIPNEPTDTPSV
uniref:DUF6261 family protein n=1 Tax=Roseihalotalea indica TaxID=2867963 RepID=A0AA49GPC4_9BACT|nr:DUF6261 family protein [Tunicatimonas sp. TK19036]